MIQAKTMKVLALECFVLYDFLLAVTTILVHNMLVAAHMSHVISFECQLAM